MGIEFPIVLEILRKKWKPNFPHTDLFAPKGHRVSEHLNRVHFFPYVNRLPQVELSVNFLLLAHPREKIGSHRIHQ